MQLFRTRAHKTKGNKVLVMLHEAQTGYPGGDFFLYFVTCLSVHQVYSYLGNNGSKRTRKD